MNIKPDWSLVWMLLNDYLSDGNELLEVLNNHGLYIVSANWIYLEYPEIFVPFRVWHTALDKYDFDSHPILSKEIVVNKVLVQLYGREPDEQILDRAMKTKTRRFRSAHRYGRISYAGAPYIWILVDKLLKILSTSRTLWCGVWYKYVGLSLYHSNNLDYPLDIQAMDLFSWEEAEVLRNSAVADYIIHDNTIVRDVQILKYPVEYANPDEDTDDVLPIAGDVDQWIQKRDIWRDYNEADALYNLILDTAVWLRENTNALQYHGANVPAYLHWAITWPYTLPGMEEL